MIAKMHVNLLFLIINPFFARMQRRGLKMDSTKGFEEKKKNFLEQSTDGGRAASI